MRLRTLDLFCGGGGSSWGAMKAGAEIVCGVDAWPLAVATYAANFPSARAINLTLDQATRVSALGNLGEIDLILASPECTHHTCARGSRPRDEQSKRTATYVLNFARKLHPRWIVLENVVPMRSWQGYAPLLSDLEGLGYNVREEVLNAADFGVPQTRRRLFVLCDLLSEPSQVTRPSNKRSRKASSSVRLDGPWASGPLYTERRASGTLVRAASAIKALGKGVPFLLVYYGSDGGGGWQPLDRPLRTMTTLDRFGLVTWEGKTPMLRMLQVPELKKAMGFSPDYELPCGTRRDRVKLLGNGVCPPVMEAVVRSLTMQGRLLQAAE